MFRDTNPQCEDAYIPHETNLSVPKFIPAPEYTPDPNVLDRFTSTSDADQALSLILNKKEKSNA